MLRFCHLMHSMEFKNGIKFGSLICSKHNLQFLKSDNLLFYNYVSIYGTLYKRDTIVVSNLENTEKEFGKIVEIVVFNNEIHFYLELYEEITFDEHYHAYIVSCTNKYRLLSYKNLPTIPPVLLCVKNDTKFIATEYIL